MAYIGRPLQVANLAVQSGTGDGSDTTPIATLDYATVTNGIAVYLDGVRQLAGTDFNVTAQTTLTFTTAPANGVGVDVYFLGLELSIPTPADATVTAAKLASNAVTSVKIIDDAVTLAKMAPGTDGNIISYDASGNPVAIATGSDGQVLTSAGAGAPPAFEAAAEGLFLQIVAMTVAEGAGSNTIPFDDTLPLVAEGAQIGTANITPADSSNKVLIMGAIQVATDGNTGVVCTLFNGSTLLQSRCFATTAGGAANSGMVSFMFLDSPASASAVTYSIRIGSSSGNWYTGQDRSSGGDFGDTADDGVYLLEVSA
jgi:hypothetical protein